METLMGTAWPNQHAALTARAIVIRILRAVERLRISSERLAVEAQASEHTHASEMQAVSNRSERLRASIVTQRDVFEATILEELAECDAEKEAHASALRTQRVEGSVGAFAMKSGLTGRIAKLKEEHAEERTGRVRSERREKKLQEEIASLVAARKHDAALAASELQGVQATVAKLQEDLRLSAEARGLLRQELERTKQAGVDMEKQLNLKLEERNAAMLAESERLQKEIDHMHSLQAAALAAGERGRQMHYIDSLRKRPPRAYDESNRANAMDRVIRSWRDSKELVSLARSDVDDNTLVKLMTLQMQHAVREVGSGWD